MWYFSEGHIEIIDERLTIAQKDVVTLANEFETPIYVCNTTRVVKNYLKVKTALDQNAGSHSTRVFYAMKANGAPEILLALKEANADIEVASINELKLLLELGFAPQKIFFTGIDFGLKNTEFLAKSGVTINIDSFTQLELFKPFAPLSISIRFNPGVSTGFNEKLEMSGDKIGAGKLGIHRDRILEAFHLAKSYDLDPIGLHQHIGSNYFGKNLYTFFEATRTTLEVAKELFFLGFNLKNLNLGGGLGVKSTDQMQEFPLQSFCDGIWSRIKVSGLSFETVSIEPGRYIVADSCLLLSTVNMVEEKAGIQYIGLDSGPGSCTGLAGYSLSTGPRRWTGRLYQFSKGFYSGLS
jgi:diaminopimelate decarboxylase